eukprot:TRINITY_DN2312_c2_g1_i4.p1 TRINITY_DN2312_c2_g1~~TRINITY_DN2312_c2_g1_i4.p1  ORF type:complete len:122 (+),score=11.99 TRINITY_DN2312_c2_g1_i4:246-611(+)
MYKWDATIFGPESSIWEGGIFQLKIIFPYNYPNNPPKVTFVSPIFHPNVYSNGDLCLDILQNNWKPIYTVSTVLTSIRSLLDDPNPASPANPIAATLFKENMKQYKKKVRICVERSLECAF